MNIQPLGGEPMRYQVESRSHPGEFHMVDLSVNEGHGQCSCRRFVTTCGPRLARGEPHWTDRTACAHLRACWMEWTKELLPRLARLHHHPPD